ncbi:MAG: methyltransferase domain-containing protein [Fimbriimonadaceae bacterium]
MDQVHFDGSVPEAYHRYFQPLVFDPFAGWFASRICESNPSRILELACGTGSLTTELVGVCTGEIVATDLQPGMIELARCALERSAIAFEVADAQKLPYAEALFDSVACQFGYMFIPDKAQALREAKRVLAPDAMLHLLVWRPLEENEVSHIARDVIVPFLPEGTPRPFDGPFGFSGEVEFALALKTAGFRDFSFEVVNVKGGDSDPQSAARAFCRGTPISQDLGERTNEAEIALTQAYRHRFGPIISDHTLSALYVKARN